MVPLIGSDISDDQPSLSWQLHYQLDSSNSATSPTHRQSMACIITDIRDDTSVRFKDRPQLLKRVVHV